MYLWLIDNGGIKRKRSLQFIPKYRSNCGTYTKVLIVAQVEEKKEKHNVTLCKHKVS